MSPSMLYATIRHGQTLTNGFIDDLTHPENPSIVTASRNWNAKNVSLKNIKSAYDYYVQTSTFQPIHLHIEEIQKYIYESK